MAAVEMEWISNEERSGLESKSPQKRSSSEQDHGINSSFITTDLTAILINCLYPCILAEK